MRKVLSDRSDVVLERREMLVRRWLQQQCELRQVNLEAIHLLMVESEAPNDRLRIETFLSCGAEPGVAGKGLVLFKPSADRPLRHFQMCPLADNPLGIGDWVAEVERGNGLKNRLEGIGLALAGFVRESGQAFSTLKYLQYPQAIASLSFPDRIFRLALWATRIFLLRGWCGHDYGNG